MVDPLPLQLRPASEEDSDWLLELRNDPAVRAASRNTHVVDPAGHARWLRETLADPARDLFVAELGAEPVGQVRLDRLGAEDREISISLVASRRGDGLAIELIRAAVDRLRGERDAARAIAEVRVGNEASLRAFRAAGFRETGGPSSEGFTRLELSLER